MWVGTHENNVPRPATSAVWHSQASKSAIFCENTRNLVSSTGTQLVYVNFVKITACKNTGGPVQN